jgi:hypothetical protein
MRIARLIFPYLMLPALTPLWSQLSAPNEMGVSMGQLHTIVRDVEATKRVWVALGGEPIRIDGVDASSCPGSSCS